MRRRPFLGGASTEFKGKILKFGTEIELVCGEDLFYGAHTDFHSVHTKQAQRGNVDYDIGILTALHLSLTAPILSCPPT